MLPVHRVARRKVALVPAALAACVLLAAGCGRRATQADCRLIVDKSVELQMRDLSLGSPEDIQKREEQVRAELEGELESCEGRRVTDRMMECVQAAKATQELYDCLR